MLEIDDHRACPSACRPSIKDVDGRDKPARNWGWWPEPKVRNIGAWGRGKNDADI
jgi:hypothetical protein